MPHPAQQRLAVAWPVDILGPYQGVPWHGCGGRNAAVPARCHAGQQAPNL